MKRIAIALLMLVMIAMVGCGSEKSVETVAPAAVPTTIPETLSPTEVPTPEPTTEPTPEPTATLTPKPTPTPTPKPTALPNDLIVGTWKTCRMITDSSSYSMRELESLLGRYDLSYYYFVFKENGEAFFTLNGQSNTSRWKTDDSKVIVVNLIQLLWDGGYLAWELDDSKLLFERISNSQDTESIKQDPYIGATLGQRNALDSAKAYLRLGSGFSYKKLVEQLEYEQYTHEEAVYAVDNCGADWNEQAVLSARAYLKSSSFSKNGLISQLEYEGFTHEQAVYAVGQVGY